MATLRNPIRGRILLAILVTAGCGLSFTAAAQTPSGECAVAALRGPALILRDGSSVPAASGTALRSDDQIIAGPRARLKLACRSGFEITIGSDTSISMRALEGAGTTEKSVVDLIGGIIRISLAPFFARERLELRTPTAVAAARSTAWVADASNANTAIFVIAGEVGVSSPSGSGLVIVSAGFGTDVAAGSVPAAPARWGQSRAEQALQRTAAP